MRKRLKWLLALSIAGAIAAAAYLSYRNKVMDHLYAEAAGYPQFYRGSRESQAAVKQLGTYRGRRSTDMLLHLALGNNPLAPEAQTEAIKALRERKDPEVADALANLLQPHEALATRQAAAEVLKDLPCKGECIRSIVHYLERIWRGEPNDEDRWVLPPGNEEVTAGHKRGQRAVYASLYSVLQRQKLETLTNLMRVYGLGSDGPSPFALDLVSRLGLHEACPYLLQSDRQLKDLSPESFKGPRKELQAAIASLGCR